MLIMNITVSDSCNITLEEQDIGTHFFPHLKMKKFMQKLGRRYLQTDIT